MARRVIVIKKDEVADEKLLSGIFFYSDPARAFIEMGGEFEVVTIVKVEVEEWLGTPRAYTDIETEICFLNPARGAGWKVKTKEPVLTRDQARLLINLLRGEDEGAWCSSPIKELLEKRAG